MRIVKYSWRHEIKITQADVIMGIKTVKGGLVQNLVCIYTSDV